MRMLAGAVLVLAGSVLAGAGVLAEVLFVTSPQRGGAGVPAATGFAQYGGLLVGVAGLVVLFTGWAGARRGDS